MGDRARAAAIGVLWLLQAVPAAADDAERQAMVRVRLTTEATVLAGCTRLGPARDDSVKDLRRKIVRAGGDAALLTFGVDDLDMIHAEVFRCAGAQVAPPAGIPAPPAGAPPPPPPGATR